MEGEPVLDLTFLPSSFKCHIFLSKFSLLVIVAWQKLQSSMYL